MRAVALAPGRPDYPGVNYSGLVFLFLSASPVATSQITGFALRTDWEGPGGGKAGRKREKLNSVV